ncbi:MAG: MBL fold metallo-hydrolase [Acidobacteriota bacterium]
MGQNLRVKFLGVRGSYPVCSREFLRFGGNTPSVLLEFEDTAIIFDAGTGIINAVKELKNKDFIWIFLSHLHQDHIEGYPFFILNEEIRRKIDTFGPNFRKGFFRILSTYFSYSFSPIPFKRFMKRESIFGLNGGEIIFTDDNTPQILRRKNVHTKRSFYVESIKMDSHPNDGVLVYKTFLGNRSIVYATDVELNNNVIKIMIEFCRNADILIHDSQYTDEEYFSNANPKKGFGHSTWRLACELAKKSEVKRLILFHHDPFHSDGEIEKIEREAKKVFSNSYAAYENMEMEL